MASTFSEQNHCVPRLHSSTHRQDSRARRANVHRPDEVVLHSLILEFLLHCSLPSVSLLPFGSALCCCSRKLLLPRHCRNQLESVAVHVLYDVLLRTHVRDPLPPAPSALSAIELQRCPPCWFLPLDLTLPLIDSPCWWECSCVSSD